MIVNNTNKSVTFNYHFVYSSCSPQKKVYDNSLPTDNNNHPKDLIIQSEKPWDTRAWYGCGII
jgi:hypothetical protein